MNKLILSAFISSALLSCNDSKVDVAPDNTTIDTSKLASPVRYVNWEIGDFNNLVTITNFYKLWDSKQSDTMASYFSDTVRLRLPEEKAEIVVPNNQVNERLARNRKMYGYTSNEIVSAVSLRDKSSGEEWVMVTTYAKWTEKNGERDSVLYHDDWRLKNGKINLLMSFAKTPTTEFLNNQPGR
jgi:hypothetical protein